jgi:hypothetical protein
MVAVEEAPLAATFVNEMGASAMSRLLEER